MLKYARTKETKAMGGTQEIERWEEREPGNETKPFKAWYHWETVALQARIERPTPSGTLQRRPSA